MTGNLTPPEIEKAYYADGIVSESILTGGIVNTTLLIKDKNQQKSILQRLSPIYDESMAVDFDVVSDHLQLDGWEVANAIKSRDGNSFEKDSEGRLWRSFTYIESDGVVPEPSLEANIALSGLLGSLHNSLSTLDYSPQFALPHFHETTYYSDKLEGLLLGLDARNVRELGVKCISLVRENSIPNEPRQLIHGDPKLTNALYRDGSPFTFIDFDTLMKGNPLIDVGDMLRSITGKELAKNSDFNTAQIEPIIEAYYETAKPSEKAAQFIKQALNAGQVIALELGIRYLIDSVENEYFEWDYEQFESRSAHNIARAKIQWQTFEALKF